MRYLLTCLTVALFSHAHASATPTDGVFLTSKLQASSGAVSVYEIANDWQGKRRNGDYAFANAQVQFGLQWQQWQVAVEQRQYYYLAFNQAAATYYYQVKNAIKTADRFDVDLNLRLLEAQGIRFSKRFELGSFYLQPSYVGYRINGYQLARVQGNVAGDQGLSVSASVDYHYDQDQILQAPYQGGGGGGDSVDVVLGYHFAHWQLQLSAQDIYNRWRIQEAGYTRGCINLAGNVSQVCSSGATTGNSGVENYLFRLPTTWLASAEYQPYQLQLSAYQHDRYQRFSLQKNWSTPIGRLGVSGHSTQQLGLHWHSRYHQFSLLSDRLNWQHAHHLQLDLGVQLPF